MKVEKGDDGVGCSKESHTRRVLYTTEFLEAPIASVVAVLVQLQYSINRISTLVPPCFTPVSIKLSSYDVCTNIPYIQTPPPKAPGVRRLHCMRTVC